MIILLLMLSLLIFLMTIFILTNSRFLTALVILESMVLVSLILVLIWLVKSLSALNIFILLLTFGVCEASLALSLLLSYIKVCGNDIVHSTSSLI
uniref:NADH dehydrogenase subunit 4L n=1 Tax=Megalophaedusa pinguis platyauchen TaxID=1885708 RepID=A0A224ACA4_9EUPU|nr:NADH dehydrogenase subunit 4L [Megalophaedusa pinguis platyauchen]